MWKRRRGKSWTNVKKIWLFMPILIIILLLILLLNSPLFLIKKIDILTEGLECADKKQVESLAKLFGQNFFLINFFQITTNLKKQYICVKSINYSKVFPDQIKLKVLSRTPKAVLFLVQEKEASLSAIIANAATPSAQSRERFLIDDEGIIFSKAESGLIIPQIGIINSVIFIAKKSNQQIINAIVILDKIKTLGIEAESSWIEDNYLLILTKEGNTKIIFRVDSGIDIQLASLQLILSEAKISLTDLEFIDLRFDKPVVRVVPKKHGER